MDNLNKSRSLIEKLPLIIAYFIVGLFSLYFLVPNKWALSVNNFKALTLAIIPSFYFYLKSLNFEPLKLKYKFLLLSTILAFLYFVIFKYFLKLDHLYGHPFHSWHLWLTSGTLVIIEVHFFAWVQKKPETYLGQEYARFLMTLGSYSLIHQLMQFSFIEKVNPLWSYTLTPFILALMLIIFSFIKKDRSNINVSIERYRTLAFIHFLAILTLFALNFSAVSAPIGAVIVGLSFLGLFYANKILRLISLSFICLQLILFLKQAFAMNFEVTYFSFVYLGATLLLVAISEFLSQKLKPWVLIFSLPVLVLGILPHSNPYQLNLESLKASLKLQAKEIKILEQGKIVQKKETLAENTRERVHLDENLLFMKVLSKLVMSFSSKNFQDLFSFDLEKVFLSSRPLYTDENFNKYKASIKGVMRRLNLDLPTTRNQNIGKARFVITSVADSSAFKSLDDDDLMTSNLRAQNRLKSGELLRGQIDLKAGVYYLLVNDQVALEYSFGELLKEHLPKESKLPEFKVTLQPSELTKTVELDKLRLKVRLTRIYGVFSNQKLEAQNIQGEIFIKYL